MLNRIVLSEEINRGYKNEKDFSIDFGTLHVFLLQRL